MKQQRITSGLHRSDCGRVEVRAVQGAGKCWWVLRVNGEPHPGRWPEARDAFRHAKAVLAGVVK